LMKKLSSAAYEGEQCNANLVTGWESFSWQTCSAVEKLEACALGTYSGLLSKTSVLERLCSGLNADMGVGAADLNARIMWRADCHWLKATQRNRSARHVRISVRRQPQQDLSFLQASLRRS
jgi:hypothetical protein